jgi:hypothetical protein
MLSEGSGVGVAWNKVNEGLWAAMGGTYRAGRGLGGFARGIIVPTVQRCFYPPSTTHTQVVGALHGCHFCTFVTHAVEHEQDSVPGVREHPLCRMRPLLSLR